MEMVTVTLTHDIRGRYSDIPAEASDDRKVLGVTLLLKALKKPANHLDVVNVAVYAERRLWAEGLMTAAGVNVDVKAGIQRTPPGRMTAMWRMTEACAETD